MDAKAKEGLAEAIRTAAKPVLVRSAFELPAVQRDVLQRALNEIFSIDVHVRFETAPELVGGIELATDGHKAAWSIAEYLMSLEMSVDLLLKERDRPAFRTEAPKLQSTDQ